MRILVAIGDGGRPADAIVIDWLDRRIYVGGRLALKGAPAKRRAGASMPFVAVALVLCAAALGRIEYADLIDALWGDDPDGGPLIPINSIRAMLWRPPARRLLAELGLSLRSEYGSCSGALLIERRQAPSYSDSSMFGSHPTQ